MANIVKLCQDCNGSGYRSDTEGTQTQLCNICQGSGYLVEFQVDLSDLADKLDDVLDKLADIKELLTTT